MSRRRVVAAVALSCALPSASADAAMQVVANPAPGVTSVFISDEATPGTITIRATTPVQDGHFSAFVLDRNGDGAADLSVVVTRVGATRTVEVRGVSGSTTDCQQYAGSAASPVPGASGAVAADDSRWTATIPTTQVPGDFRWAIRAAAPAEPCGGTDGEVVGLPITLADGETFTRGPGTAPDVTPPAAPGGLTATAGDTQVALDWADNSEADLAGYLVYRRVVGSGSFALVAQTAASQLTNTGLANGTAYEFYVRAQDTTGNVSDESARATAVPVAALGSIAQPGPRSDADPVPTRNGPPRGSRFVRRVGALQLRRFTTGADRSRYRRSTGTATLGILFNPTDRPATVTGRFRIRVVRGRLSNAAAVVTVARRTFTVAPGRAVAVRFRMSSRGRRAVRGAKAVRIRCSMAVVQPGAARSVVGFATRVGTTR